VKKWGLKDVVLTFNLVKGEDVPDEEEGGGEESGPSVWV
jgi:hypothetical protein